jgi:hypothetical protein
MQCGRLDHLSQIDIDTAGHALSVLARFAFVLSFSVLISISIIVYVWECKIVMHITQSTGRSVSQTD